MSMYISQQTVGDNVPAGTMIGALTAKQGSIIIPCTFALLQNPNEYFAISGNNLITAAQPGKMVPGLYSVQVSATPVTLLATSHFTITVTPAASAIIPVGR